MLKATKNNTPMITLGLLGDVMLGRLVNEKIASLNQKSPKSGYEYVWGDMLALLRANTLNLINLETTLTTSQEKTAKVFNFKAEPHVVEALKVGQISVVNLANNHIRDFSISGLKETISTLDRAGIQHVGAGNNIMEARKPAIIEKNGIKIAFFRLYK